jgi:hypothetical protein
LTLMTNHLGIKIGMGEQLNGYQFHYYSSSMVALPYPEIRSCWWTATDS